MKKGLVAAVARGLVLQVRDVRSRAPGEGCEVTGEMGFEKNITKGSRFSLTQFFPPSQFNSMFCT